MKDCSFYYSKEKQMALAILPKDVVTLHTGEKQIASIRPRTEDLKGDEIRLIDDANACTVDQFYNLWRGVVRNHSHRCADLVIESGQNLTTTQIP